MNKNLLNVYYNDFKTIFLNKFIKNNYFCPVSMKTKESIDKFILKANSENIIISTGTFNKNIHKDMFQVYFIDKLTHKTKYIQITYNKYDKKIIKIYLSE